MLRNGAQFSGASSLYQLSSSKERSEPMAQRLQQATQLQSQKKESAHFIPLCIGEINFIWHGGEGHCVLKWGITRTFTGSQKECSEPMAQRLLLNFRVRRKKARTLSPCAQVRLGVKYFLLLCISHGKYLGWNGITVEISYWADLAQLWAGKKNSLKHLCSHCCLQILIRNCWW